MKRKLSIMVSVFFSVVISTMLSSPSNVWAQSDRTLGLIMRDSRAFEGYTLYKPLGGTSVYLFNNAGNPVHKWTIPAQFIPSPPSIPEGVRPGGEVFLRKNGELVFTLDYGIAALNPDSTLAWVIDSRVPGHPGQQGRWFGHHEVVELPNGNMLLPGFIPKTRAEAIQAGFDVGGADVCTAKNPNSYPPLNVLRVDNIWELAPNDPAQGFKSGWKVVWNWNLWDHFIHTTSIADHPGMSDIGYIDPAEGTCGQYIQGAWTFGRFNALGYNADRDEIVMSESLKNEIWIINHKITTDEAKGSAGDLLYRWGNPYAYGAGSPFVDKDHRGDQKLSFQHRVQWISPGLPGEGHLLIFNNGTDWGESSVIELVTPIDEKGKYFRVDGQPFGPAEPVWQYRESPPGSFFAALISSAQRLPNGNTLINNGPAGYIFEVTPQGEKVWEYIHPSGATPGPVTQGQVITNQGLYRAWRYVPDHPGLDYLDLTPGDPLETYPKTYYVDVKPGSCGNEINRESHGVLPVAILGSKNFDVKTIDPSSILLEGFPPIRWSVEDVGVPGKCKGSDGYPDLVLKFDSDLIKIALGAASKGDEFLLRLTGYSSGGWFLGREEVFIEK